jgi:recombination protein RecA
MVRKKASAYKPASPEQIDTFQKEILKDWGPKAKAGPEIKDSELQSISTGSTKLDWALGVPFVEGSINEYYGENAVGKTSFALEVAANATLLGKPVFFFDLERKLRESQLKMFPRLNLELFTRVRPDTGEEAVDKVEKCIKEVPGCVVIFDSVTQMLPEVEGAESSTKQTMGLVARLCAKMIRKISGPVERNRCMVLFISHITSNLNPYASGDTTKGGKAIPDISSQRVRLKKLNSKLIKNKGGDIIGQQVICRVMKNNMARPYIEVEVPLIYGSGIDRSMDLLQLARDLGIIDYANGWYSYVSEEFPEGKNKREAELLTIITTDKTYRDSIVNQVKELLG